MTKAKGTVTVKKGTKSVSKPYEAVQYASGEELLSQEYKGSMTDLLKEWNENSVKAAKAVARQAAYVILQGPSKAIFAMARKMFRDSERFPDAVKNPQMFFDMAKSAYVAMKVEGADKVEYDEKKIVGEELDEEESETEEQEPTPVAHNKRR